jgi:hypothetical protein
MSPYMVHKPYPPYQKLLVSVIGAAQVIGCINDLIRLFNQIVYDLWSLIPTCLSQRNQNVMEVSSCSVKSF